ITIAPATTMLSLRGPRGDRPYGYQSGFQPNLGFNHALSFTGPAVFVGTSSDVTAGRLGGLDLRGAVAVINGSAPDAVDDTLHARGAAGLIQVTGDEAQYLLYVRSRGDSRLLLSDS